MVRTLNIEPIIEDEAIKKCVIVLQIAFGTVADTFDLTRENCASNAAFIDYGKLKSQMAKGVQLFGAYVDGELVGCIGIKQKNKSTFEIMKLAVLPNYRGQHIGSHLLLFACKRALEGDGSKVLLGMIDRNKVLKEWYLKHGFEISHVKMFKKLPFEVCFLEKRML